MKARTYYSVAVIAIIISVIAYNFLASARWRATILDTSNMTPRYSPGDELLGGGASVSDTSKNCFGRSAHNLVREHWSSFYAGKGIFIREWDGMADGSRPPLGPRFNAVACERCHERDGRGAPPRDTVFSESMVVRLRAHGDNGKWGPDPAYGEQLNTYNTDGTPGEGSIGISYDERDGEYADGSSYTLLAPEYSFRHLAYGSLGSDVHFSPRVAPQNFGLGLLEAIPEEAIVANADPADRDNDGISGKANYVADVRNGRRALGRFGWKANQPTIEQQIAKAFNADLGITSSLFPADGSDGSIVRPAGISSSQSELSGEDLADIVFYVRLLGVPRGRGWERPEVQHGSAIFNGIGCARCHMTRFVTGEVPEFPELSRQVIHPYTDLLLHDMGEDLADDCPDGLATGREWRTPPLWGIGLIDIVSGHTWLLHDGRARTLEEAVLWHGGEARQAQEEFRRLRREDRKALLTFLESL